MTTTLKMNPLGKRTVKHRISTKRQTRRAEYAPERAHPIARARALRDELAAALHTESGAPLDAAADVRAMREERLTDA